MGGCCSRPPAAAAAPVVADDDDADAARPADEHDPSSSSRNHRGPTDPSQTRSKSILPNTPLRPLNPARRCELPDPRTIPTSTSSENPGAPWSRAKLERERRDWWDTRDQGSQQIWQAYRQMIKHLQQGEVQEAQTLLDATGCTCPDGKLWHSIFDETGVEYSIRDPRRNFQWVVFEPRGLVEEERKQDFDGQSEQAESSTRAAGKGKQRATDGEGVIMAACRLSTTGKDLKVKVNTRDPVGVLKAELASRTGIEERRIRVSYFGRLYASDEYLPSEGPRAFDDTKVLTILIMEEA